MKTNWFKRTLCSILAFVMVLGYVPATAFASEEDGLCEHHTQHTEACGYSPAVEGHDCGHAHTDECYQSVTECVHTHGECGYVPSVDGQNCECQPDENGEIVHTDGCGYVEAVAEVSCGHDCSEENGCVTKTLNCQHQHDDVCGYVKEVAETPCGLECSDCAKDAMDKEAANRVAALITALPTVDAVKAKPMEAQEVDYNQVQAAYDAYSELTDEQKTLITNAEETFEALFNYFNALISVDGEIGSGTPDGTPPVILSITISADKVTTTGSVTVVAEATDDISGVSSGSVLFYCEETGRTLHAFLQKSYYDSEKGETVEMPEGQFIGKLNVNQYLESGVFKLRSLSMSDIAGNSVNYFESTIPDAFKALQFEVVNTGADITTSTNQSTFVKDITNAANDAYIVADFSSNTTLPKEAFDSLANTEKTLDLTSEGVTWRFEGSDITNTTKDIDLSVQITKAESNTSDVGQAIQDKLNDNPGYIMKFAENGELPGKATIQIKVDYAMREHLGSSTGLNVYYYNNQTGELELIASDLKVINDTYVEFPITHCSYYVLTNPNSSNGGATPIGVAVDKTNFPDDNFRAWILEQDYGKDGILTAQELENVTWMEVHNLEIANLTGLVHFKALAYLDCRGNQLTNLDISSNTALDNLYCQNNLLTSLDTSKQPALTSLCCSDNSLTYLDVSNNTALTHLDCTRNQLTKLDVTKNIALTSLSCIENQLTQLDISKNLLLETLECQSNLLTVLDISSNTALTRVDCGSNQLTALDVSKNTVLTSLACYHNQIAALDVSGNTALTDLNCNSNQLTKLDVSHNTELDRLSCDANQLTQLDVGKNTRLTYLGCGSNQLTVLDISKNTALQVLHCDNNQLTALDVSLHPELRFFTCYYNQLTTLDVGNNPLLTNLECQSNQLTQLDVSKNTALESLSCGFNQLTSLDLSSNPKCSEVNATGNRRQIKLNSDNTFVLSTLPGFDISKASKWTGGTVSNGILTMNSTVVSYDYQVSKGMSVRFTLTTGTPASGPDPNLKQGDCGDNLHWQLNGSGLRIYGTGAMWDYDANNPAPWEQYANTIQSVTILHDATTIGHYAFEGLSSLTQVTIPNTILSIGEAAFACTALTGIDIPNGVTSISCSAFAKCTALQEVKIPASVKVMGPCVFEQCGALSTVTFLGDTPNLSQELFLNNTLTARYPAGNSTWTSDKLQNYGGTITWKPFDVSGTCGENVTWTYNAGSLTISGTGAMYDYSQDQTNPAPWNHLAGYITKLVIEEGVTTIGDFAFAECSAIKNASFPSTLTRVGKYPFYRFSLPNGNVYYRFFWSEVNQTVRQWSQIQFEGDSERFIGGDCTNFVCHSPIIASGKYGDRVYWDLNENGTMEFFGSGDMEEFGATGSWLYDEYAKTIVITEGITNIGMNAFEAYSPDPLSVTLESVRIASTVKRVEEMAFAGCQVLKNITFVGDAPTFGETCFREVTATAYYPAGNATWTEAVMQDYEGDITWVPYCQEHSFGEWIVEGTNSHRTCIHCGYTEHKVVTDSGDVEIEIPDQPDLEVEVDPVLPSEDNYVLVEEALDSTGNQNQAILKVFDINLKNSEGVHVQPSGTVKVKIPLDWSKNGNYKVYRVNDDGTLTDMNAYQQGSHMVFETDHFSLYVIVEENTEKRLNLAGSDLAEESIIWIDGIAYPVLTADNGRTYVELPENVPPVLVTYSYNSSSDDRHTQYPTGMQVYRISEAGSRYTVERIQELDNLLQYSGSSIRITGNKGIRMITSVNQNTRNALTGNGLAGFKLLEYGTLLAQTSKLGNNPLVLGGGEYVKSNYAYKKGVADPVFKYANGLIQYTNVLIGFTDEQCKEDIAMRPYMKLQDKNGEEFVIYGGIVYRSIGYIAYQNRNAFQPGSAAYEYVWSIIHNVYGNQYDSEYKK